MIIDTRPKRGAWAPGWYSCKCTICNDEYMGDKRSLNCAFCAYTIDHLSLEELRDEYYQLNDRMKHIKALPRYSVRMRKSSEHASYMMREISDNLCGEYIKVADLEKI